MVKNIDTALFSYVSEVANYYNLELDANTTNNNYTLASKVDSDYVLGIEPALSALKPPQGYMPPLIGGITFGDVYFTDADDETFKLIISKLITGNYRVYDTPVNKYLKYLFFFTEFNNKCFKFYNDDGSEVTRFDYRITGDAFPLSYYRGWPK